MKKFFKFTWFPVIMVFVLTIIFGGAALVQAQNQNDVLKNKVSELSQKVSTFPTVKVAGSSTEISEQLSDSTTISNDQEVFQGNTQSATALPTSLPTPTPRMTPESKQKPVTTPLSTPTPTPTPTPVPTPMPTPIPQKLATVEVQNLGNFQVEVKENDTAFLLLLRAAQENNFPVTYQNYGDLGAFVDCIGNVCNHDNYYWAFYYNNAYSMVGASTQTVSEGDITTWKFETW